MEREADRSDQCTARIHGLHAPSVHRQFGRYARQSSQRSRYHDSTLNAIRGDQIVDLAGCDLLTIGTDLLSQLQKREGTLARRLSVEDVKAKTIPRIALDEKTYRFEHNQDQMAVEKLSDGIRSFYADARKLEKYAYTQVAKTPG